MQVKFVAPKNSKLNWVLLHRLLVDVELDPDGYYIILQWYTGVKLEHTESSRQYPLVGTRLSRGYATRAEIYSSWISQLNIPDNSNLEFVSERGSKTHYPCSGNVLTLLKVDSFAGISSSTVVDHIQDPHSYETVVQFSLSNQSLSVLDNSKGKLFQYPKEGLILDGVIDYKKQRKSINSYKSIIDINLNSSFYRLPSAHLKVVVEGQYEVYRLLRGSDAYGLLSVNPEFKSVDTIRYLNTADHLYYRNKDWALFLEQPLNLLLSTKGENYQSWGLVVTDSKVIHKHCLQLGKPCILIDIHQYNQLLVNSQFDTLKFSNQIKTIPASSTTLVLLDNDRRLASKIAKELSKIDEVKVAIPVVLFYTPPKKDRK